MKLVKVPSVLLAFILQFAPLAGRLVQTSPALAASPLAIVLKWITAAVAVAGSYHTVSAATAVLKSATSVKGTNGVALTYRIEISDGKTRSPGAWDLNGVRSGKTNGLPFGLSLSTTTGIISGTPKESGVFPVTVKAYEHSNRTGATLTFTLTFTIVDGAAVPVITGPPTDTSVNVGDPVSFQVVATGSSLSYQWLHDDVTIDGATAATYPIAAAKESDAGLYKVRVTSGSQSVTSSAARLTVKVPTTVSALPAAVVLHSGEALALSVTATGKGTLKYQWRKGANDLAGATTSSYQVAAVGVGDTGNYSVVVTGDDGVATSNSCVVNVLPLAVPVPVKNGAGVTLTFNAINGRSYRLESALSVGSPSWTPLGTVQAVNGSVTFQDDPGATAKFWRIRLMP